MAQSTLRVIPLGGDRKSTRLNSSHSQISYAVFCLKKPRATTESTIHTFMTLNPSPSKYLCVSNGYFVPYQELVIQNFFYKQWPTAGLIPFPLGPAFQA